MKLAAIYNVWDGEELLHKSIDQIKEHVDLIIIVYQNISNFGEPHSPRSEMDLNDINEYYCPVIYQKYVPNIGIGGTANETNKRNLGLAIAKKHGCTHFLHMDVDEFYHDFGDSLNRYESTNASGSVCPIYTYFKKPTWRLQNLDGYFVPFIHKLHDHTVCGGGFKYPFYCDPTRVINDVDVALIHTPMHHYSWVRNDIERKARNSSAGQHGNKLSGLLTLYNYLDDDADLVDVTVPDMGNQKLMVVPDIFNLSEIFSIKHG